MILLLPRFLSINSFWLDPPCLKSNMLINTQTHPVPSLERCLLQISFSMLFFCLSVFSSFRTVTTIYRRVIMETDTKTVTTIKELSFLNKNWSLYDHAVLIPTKREKNKPLNIFTFRIRFNACKKVKSIMEMKQKKKNYW